MATYYVDATDGDDAKDGLSEANAWKTISKVNGETFAANDNILFQRGETWVERLIPPSSGTSGNPITFSAYGTGTAPIIQHTTTSIRIDTVSYIVIDNLIVQGSTSTSNWGAITLDTGDTHDFITIQNCEVRNTSGQGIKVRGTAKGIIIKNNDIHDNGGGAGTSTGIGIDVATVTVAASDPILIHDNEVYDNSERAGIAIFEADNVWIYNNNVHDNGSNQYFGSGISLFTTNDCKIYNNIITGHKGDTNDGGGIIIDQASDGAEVYYNLSYLNDGPGISAFGATNLNIYNNVCYGNNINSSTELTVPGEIRLTSNGVNQTSNVNVKNNIGFGTETSAYGIHVDADTADNAGIVIDYNLWYRASGDWWKWGASTGNTLSGWRTASSQGDNDINNDPLFVNAATADFHIQSGSPCRDAGTPVGLTQDFWGNPVPK